MPPRVEQSSLWNVSQTKTTGEASIFYVPVHIFEHIPDHRRSCKSKGELQREEEKTQDVSSESCHMSLCDNRGGDRGPACEEKNNLLSS